MKFSEFLQEASETIHDFHDGNIDFDWQNRETLDGVPIPPLIAGSFNCSRNKLTSLVGGPRKVLHDYRAHKNLLSNFDGFPEFVGMTMQLANNKFTSLHNIHKALKECHGGLILDNNPIKSHMLGVLLIEKLSYVRMKHNSAVENIINKYLPNNRGNDAIIDCQNDLLDAGLDEYAQL